MQDRFFFRAGSAVWIAGGIGHFVLVDVLTLHGRTRVSEFVPRADILDVMEKTTLTFGYLGSTTAFLAIAGFSVWVALSLVLFGITYLLLSWQTGVVLRPLIRMGFCVSAVFTSSPQRPTSIRRPWEVCWQQRSSLCRGSETRVEGYSERG